MIGAIAGSAIPLGLSFPHLWQIPVLAGTLFWLFAFRPGVATGLLIAGAIGIVVALAGVPVLSGFAPNGIWPSDGVDMTVRGIDFRQVRPSPS